MAGGGIEPGTWWVCVHGCKLEPGVNMYQGRVWVQELKQHDTECVEEADAV
jgi:(2Fe-2S) ferredoxin